MIYYTIIAMLICLTYLEWSGKDNNILGDKNMEKYCYVFIATLLTLVAMLRVSDPDFMSYKSHFDACLYLLQYHFEPGFTLLCVFFKKYFDNYYIMQIVVSLSCSWIIFAYFYKKSDKPIFTLLIYFVLVHFMHIHMAIQRQEIAMVIIVLGMRFVERKKIVPWILTIIFATQFHATAIVAFPLYYTTNCEVSKEKAIGIFVFAVSIALFGNSISKFICQIMSYATFLPNRALYVLRLYSHQTTEFATGLGVLSIFLCHLLVLSLYDPKQYKYMLNFMIALLFVAVNCHIPVVGRLQYYYLLCGGGFFAYNALCRMRLPIKLTFGKETNMLCSFALLSIVIIYVFSIYFVSMEYRSKNGILGKDKWKYESIIFTGINKNGDIKNNNVIMP